MNSQYYANVIESFKESYNKINMDNEKKLIENAIIQTLRKKSEYDAPRYISVKANEMIKTYFNNRNITLDTHSKVHKINNNALPIILDHCIPVQELVIKYLNKEIGINDLLENCFTAAILKSENQDLNSNGFKNKRPPRWEDAYEKCKIGIVEYK